MQRVARVLLLAALAMPLAACRSGVPTWEPPRWIPDATRAAQPLLPEGVEPLTDELLVWEGGEGKLILIDPTTAKRRTIPLPVKWPMRPSWSPDHKYIACSGRMDGRVHVVVTTPAGSWRALDLGLADGEVEPICWSPDSKRIAFRAHDVNDMGYQAVVVDLSSGRVSHIDMGRHQVSGLGWAPTGNRLAVVTMEGAYSRQSGDIIDSWWQSSLVEVHVDTGRRRVLVRGRPNGRDVSWSPAGDRILFEDLKAQHVIDANTGRFTRIPQSMGSWARTVWSPDGSEILVSTKRVHDAPDTYDVFGVVKRVRPDGQGIGSWERPEEFFAIAYSPDGKRIVRQHMGSDHLIVSDLDGSNERVLGEIDATGVYWAAIP